MKKNKIKWFSKKEIRELVKNIYTSEYFIKSKKMLNCKVDNKSTMQFVCFNSDDIILAGITEVIEIIKATIPKSKLKNISVLGQKEGTLINKSKPILKIIGNYKDFCFLENIIDGILAQRCSVATNVYRIKQLLKNHQDFIYMADRINSYHNQPFDGYAAYIGGARYFTTQAEIKLIANKSEVKVIGTIPHGLIQQYDNNLSQLILDYNDIFKQKPVVLVDFENNIIKTLEQIKPVLHLCTGIRLDTSFNLTDYSLRKIPNANGISDQLIILAKNWLIENNFSNIKIYISSGLNDVRIKQITQKGLPVDVFGIGGFFLKPRVHITADLVNKDSKPFAKFGRKEINDSNLVKYI